MSKTLGTLWFSDRKKLDDLYKKWLLENVGVADDSFNVITFLALKGLINIEKAEQYLNQNYELYKVNKKHKERK